MILVDAGPLIALIDRADADHPRCVDALGNISLPLLTTWPAFAEGMYILGRQLMKKFRNVPMDLADATLVALAETTGIHRIFTLDSDFEVYRLPPHYKKALTLLPSA